MTSIRCPAGSRTNERGAFHALVPSRSVKPALRQSRERRLEVVGQHGHVALARGDRLLDRDQVDLRPLALRPR